MVSCNDDRLGGKWMRFSLKVNALPAQRFVGWAKGFSVSFFLLVKALPARGGAVIACSQLLSLTGYQNWKE